jgi:hypothetical protein
MGNVQATWIASTPLLATTFTSRSPSGTPADTASLTIRVFTSVAVGSSRRFRGWSTSSTTLWTWNHWYTDIMAPYAV